MCGQCQFIVLPRGQRQTVDGKILQSSGGISGKFKFFTRQEGGGHGGTGLEIQLSQSSPVADRSVGKNMIRRGGVKRPFEFFVFNL